MYVTKDGDKEELISNPRAIPLQGPYHVSYVSYSDDCRADVDLKFTEMAIFASKLNTSVLPWVHCLGNILCTERTCRPFSTDQRRPERFMHIYIVLLNKEYVHSKFSVST